MVQNLKTHLFNHEWETIPKEAVKRMLWSCIIGSARKEIVLFCPTELAFERYETGVFFEEMLKRFSQENHDESQRQEYLLPRQETEKGGRHRKSSYWQDEVILETQFLCSCYDLRVTYKNIYSCFEGFW